ncbi:hypothetical protein [Streptomyces sp. NBC_00842]|uniref:hypothetical protein n=1 Tax=Streptomyces sp. NBC_00842 TaxID=2975848 RepID=UPI003867031A|nr:PD-(D/E)XK nuclease family protein [Streptomyces sp. NBC_00842]
MITTGNDDTGQVMAERIGEFITNTALHAPRSLQRRIGPSEVGADCDRRLAYKLSDWPEVAADGDPIASVLGTAFHAWMEDAFTEREKASPGRYKIEERVTVRQGVTEAASLTGSSDLYDRASGTVWDWKLVGVSSLDKYRRGGPSDQYRIQAHLYGLGQENAGETPRRVAICFVGRHHELRVHVWTEPYNRQVALDALARLDAIRDQLLALDPESHPERWSEFAIPDKPNCRFCPWLKPGSTDLSTGCPGVQHANPGASLQALIA